MMKGLSTSDLALLQHACQKEKLGWSNERSPEHYDRHVIDTFLGKRTMFRPKNMTTYTWLQNSRGLQVENTDIDTLVKVADSCMMSSADIDRMDEIKDVVALDKSFIELGFRQPTIMKYLSQRFSRCIGFDINEINVLASRQLGYDVRCINLSELIPDLCELKAGLVVAYHVFEHVINPINALAMLAKTAETGTLFHLEVPIEYDSPSLRYSHMFGFYPGDLAKIMSNSGSEILFSKEMGNIDRVFARKI